ncbi:MAG TPA: hypothetical protein DDW27_02610 [Bacteroidales bacterium]|nr:hypothetical protein [Bacteroidales bacterium]
MRIHFLLLSAALISFTGINAQKPILIMEDTLKIGSNKYPGISVLIPEVEYAKTRTNWVRLQESGTRSKVVDESGKMSIFGANSKSISDTPFNILSDIVDRDTVLRLTASFELRKDGYIERSAGEAEVAKAKSFLFDFAKQQYIDLVNEQLKTEENRLKDLQKELSSLQRNQSGMERKIRSNNRRIVFEKDRILVLNNELTTLSAAIYEHNLQLNSLETGAERDEKQKYIKNMEKQKKKATRSVKKSEKNISKAERAIKDANRAIPKNDTTQDRIRRSISDQEAVVQQYVDKLNRVKAYK